MGYGQENSGQIYPCFFGNMRMKKIKGEKDWGTKIRRLSPFFMATNLYGLWHQIPKRPLPFLLVFILKVNASW
jgi:hypothetical protein